MNLNWQLGHYSVSTEAHPPQDPVNLIHGFVRLVHFRGIPPASPTKCHRLFIAVPRALIKQYKIIELSSQNGTWRHDQRYRDSSLLLPCFIESLPQLLCFSTEVKSGKPNHSRCIIMSHCELYSRDTISRFYKKGANLVPSALVIKLRSYFTPYNLLFAVAFIIIVCPTEPDQFQTVKPRSASSLWYFMLLYNLHGDICLKCLHPITPYGQKAICLSFVQTAHKTSVSHKAPQIWQTHKIPYLNFAD